MNIETKEWRTIEEAPNYEVSNYGDVRNKKTNTVLAGSADKDGYLRVVIRNSEKKLITRFRHRLAAIAFLENPNRLPLINHKDEIKTNNYVGCAECNYQDGNLEWCDPAYNVNYGTGRQKAVETKKKNRKGAYAGKEVFVYTKDKTTFIEKYASMSEAAREMKVDYRSIWKVCNQQRASAGGYFFSFVELDLTKEE